ncbi:MAG: cyclic nucleotide-binding domain-containing protein [Ardenticatenaceae bacterium]|nr:cyclic nucleotide-binding domain-containing protein [Ardenticatenaceae bacterium]
MNTINTFRFSEPNAEFQAGETIFEQGAEADLMYVVKSGTVGIELDGEVIEFIEEGGIFGEMALVDGSPRSAAAKAKTDVRLIALDEEGFKNQVHTTPYFALQVLRITTARLRRFMNLS